MQSSSCLLSCPQVSGVQSMLFGEFCQTAGEHHPSCSYSDEIEALTRRSSFFWRGTTTHRSALFCLLIFCQRNSFPRLRFSPDAFRDFCFLVFSHFAPFEGCTQFRSMFDASDAWKTLDDTTGRRIVSITKSIELCDVFRFQNGQHIAPIFMLVQNCRFKLFPSVFFDGAGDRGVRIVSVSMLSPSSLRGTGDTNVVFSGRKTRQFVHVSHTSI